MMHHDMEKRVTPEEYDRVTAKFVSEYGYVGPCCRSTIERYMANRPLDRRSRIWSLHNNTFEKATVAAGIAKHYTDPSELDLDAYILYAGLCQGLMLGYSLESLRFKEFCSGALQPVKLILRESEGRVALMGANDTARRVAFDAEYGYLPLDGKTEHLEKTSIALEPHSRKIVLEFYRGGHDLTSGCLCVRPLDDPHVLPAILRCGVFRELKVPTPRLRVSGLRRAGNALCFTVCTDTYAHAVHFRLGDDVHLSDEYFDLLPGEQRTVEVCDAKGSVSEETLQAHFIV